MTRSTALLALCSATLIDRDHDVEGVPEWVHLLPAGEIRTQDGRGPYKVVSMQAVADASMAGRPLIDECHSTDRAAPLGQSAPARGWIVEMQARDDGLWARVDWNGAGKALMADKAYCGISPVIQHTKDGTVLAVLRASLINTPNLVGLASLHSEETGMDLKAKLIELLGLDGESDDAAVMSALSAKLEKPATSEHSQQDSEAITALQSELAGALTKVKALEDERARDKAVAFVDAAIADLRVGVKPLRDRYISMHMANAENCEAIISGLPKVGGSTHAGNILPPAGEDEALDPTELAAHAATYQKKLADAGQTIDFATAVLAVTEGKHK